MARSNYAYITGKIRQLELGLPDETDIVRMLEAPDVKSAFEVLNDTDYAKNLLDVTPENFYFALHDNWRDFRKMLEDGVPDQLLLDILYLREDFNNLKIIMKAHFQGISFDEVRPTDAGSVTKETWISYFDDDARSNLNPFWQSIVDELMLSIGTPEIAQDIDRIVDKKYLEVYKELAVAFKNNFIIKLVEIEIDVANVKSCFRTRRLGRSAEWLSGQLVGGGKIPVHDIITWLELDDNDLVNKFYHRLPYTIATEIEKGYSGDGTEVIEHSLYTWRRRYLRRAIYTAYGPEHVMRYFYAKVRSLINVRVVMMGKLNGLPIEEIKNRIRL